MKAKVVTTITTLVDLDTFGTHHDVDIQDEDGLSEVSQDVLAAVVIGALHATREKVREAYPGAARADDRTEKQGWTDIQPAIRARLHELRGHTGEPEAALCAACDQDADQLARAAIGKEDDRGSQD